MAQGKGPGAERREGRGASARAGGQNSAAQNTAAQSAPTPPSAGQASHGQTQSQVQAQGGGNRSRNRNRRRRTPKTALSPAPGQVTNTTAVPVVAAPSKRGQKRPLAAPRIGVGCILLRGDEILLVRERGRWSLPKGGLESGELVQDGARRETYEETGLVVELRDLAFVVEFQAQTWGHHLQFFYTAREVGGTLQPRDPDRDVQEARFVPIRQLREFIRFRPRLVAMETWLRERRPRHFVFNLDKEPAMLRKRRRVGVGAVEPDMPNDPIEEADI